MGGKFGKKYHKKKNKENYDLNKKLSKLYQSEGTTEPWSKWKKKHKKTLF